MNTKDILQEFREKQGMTLRQFSDYIRDRARASSALWDIEKRLQESQSIQLLDEAYFDWKIEEETKNVAHNKDR